MTPSRRRAAMAALALAIAAGAPARAVIPDAAKIAEAVALKNRSEGRAVPLWIEVDLHIGGGDAVASGVLQTHPTGLARLELRSPLGFSERHLLQGNAYRASRDGEMLDTPRPFLPPLYLLQAKSGAALKAALESFGVLAVEAVLGRIEDADCYVIGGRSPREADGRESRRPSMWVDLTNYEIARIDRDDGVRFRFGPFTDFEKVRAPAWIAIEAPGQPVARLEIRRIAKADAPAAAFGLEWLTTP